MKKTGFTIIEIVTTIFILTVASMVMIHFIARDTRTQANNIDKWVTFYKELNTQYKVYRLQNPETNIFKYSEDEIFNSFSPYLNLQHNTPITNYKYKYLNGKKVTKEYKLNKFAKRPDGSIIGFKLLSQTCDDHTPCATLLIDINGENKPNKIGFDIFGLEFYKDEIHPWGYFDYNESLSYKNNCSKKGTGETCSHYYLIGGKFY